MLSLKVQGYILAKYQVFTTDPLLFPGGTGGQKESHFLHQRAQKADESQPQHEHWRWRGRPRSE